MKTPDQKIKSLEARLRLLESIVLEGKQPPCPEWDRVVEAGMNGDFGLWKEFKARGGSIPGLMGSAATTPKAVGA